MKSYSQQKHERIDYVEKANENTAFFLTLPFICMNIGDCNDQSISECVICKHKLLNTFNDYRPEEYHKICD